MFEKIVEVGLLFDFYGKLLNDKQYSVIEFYYIHDLSLSEIAEHLGISRQGVYDLLKRAETKLFTYEKKLGLAEKFIQSMSKIKQILDNTDEAIKSLEERDYIQVRKHIEEINSVAMNILETGQEVK